MKPNRGQHDSARDDLTGQVALVTGGAQGIGRAITVALASRGARVISADIAASHAEPAPAAGDFPAIVRWRADVAEEASVVNLCGAVTRQFGRLDIVVNNAGIFRATPVADITVAEWDEVMAVNLRGTFLVSREALQPMMKQRSGKIINISSMSAKTGGIAAGAHYAAAKAAVICFTKSLAIQAAPYQIHVNAVTPGLIGTDLTKAWGRKKNARLAAAIPLKKYGAPADVAEVVAFLASDRARYITGEIIDVNGGMLMD